MNLKSNTKWFVMNKTGDQDKVQEIIARSLTIVDGNGKPRISLSSDRYSDTDDVTGIEFYNEAGQTRLGIQLVNEGVRIFVVPTDTTPGLEICVNDLHCGIGIGGAIGQGTIAFLGHDTNPEKINSPFRKGQGYLLLGDLTTGNQVLTPEPDAKGTLESDGTE